MTNEEPLPEWARVSWPEGPVPFDELRWPNHQRTIMVGMLLESSDDAVSYLIQRLGQDGLITCVIENRSDLPREQRLMWSSIVGLDSP